MAQTTTPRPPVVSQAEWLAARKQLLAHEKELTQHYDRVNAERRRLPMVKIEKDYVFEGPEGKVRFGELFKSRHQLIVYHFMFDPTWDEGCPGCTGFVDDLGKLGMLESLDATFVLISRAPLAKLQGYAKKHGWDRPWYSSFGSDFNYDFHVSNDEAKAPVEYNYRSKAELVERGEDFFTQGEGHGMSVFFKDGDEIFHTYSSYGRGVENVGTAYGLLDRTPYGRQQDFEKSPPSWPQKPTYGGKPDTE